MPRTVPTNELVAVESEVPTDDRPEVSAAVEAGASLQAIEALRMGGVPTMALAELTVGRAKQVDAIRETLASGSRLRVFWGDYGAGKTHLLDLAEIEAQGLGYATARVVLSPRETSPCHPHQIYRAIVASIRLPGAHVPGIEGLLHRLMDSADHIDFRRSSPAFSRFLSPALFAYRSGDRDLTNTALDYVAAEDVDTMSLYARLHRAGYRGPSLLMLSDYRTYGRMYAHIEGTIATWCRDAGFRGLALLFDEVEFIDELVGADQRFAEEGLKHFAAVCLDRRQFTFDPEDLYKGGQTVHQSLPMRFADDQPLVTFFALTPLEGIVRAVDGMFADRSLSIEVPRFDESNREVLIQRVVALYGRAYPALGLTPDKVGRIAREVGAAIRKGGNDGSMRRILKRIIFTLDRIRYPEWGAKEASGR